MIFFQIISRPDPRQLELPLPTTEASTLEKLIAEAKARYEALTPEGKAAHDAEQRASYTRQDMD